MSNPTAKPVSWISVAAVFGCFAVFLLLVYLAYLPRRGQAAYTLSSEGGPEELATTAARKEYLVQLRGKQVAQGTSYGWVDQAKGTMHLPLERAMELTVQEINARAKK